MLFSGCEDLSDMTDMTGPYYVGEGWEQISSGYSRRYERVNIEMEGGIRYTLSDHLEKSFFVGQNSDREILLNVESVTLAGNGKKYEGKITSTVFSDTSKFGSKQRGYMKVRWDFGDDGDVNALGDSFDLVFNMKLDGRPEIVTANFKLPDAYLDPDKKN